jgi:methionyl-tRNA formyltransferase
MKIDILCSSEQHPVHEWLIFWQERNSHYHNINIVSSSKSLCEPGDLLFLISCTEIIESATYENYKKALLIHASDLPQGKGWSPHIWEILSGATTITLSLLEVTIGVDSGDIWKKIEVEIQTTDLYDEINEKLFRAELELMDFAVDHVDTISPIEQDLSIEATYYKKRSPSDSKLDENKSIKDNFNLIRVSDPKRFPAFFYIDGVKFKVYIEKDNEQ